MLLNEIILAKPIIEDISREELSDGVLCRVSYPIANIGKRNANNRVYEDAVYDKVMGEKDLQEKLEDRCLFGHAEHPEQTQSNLEKTSHVIIEMWKDNGQVWQKFDILDTPTGRIVDCLLRANCSVGCSTRAEGDLEEAEDDEGTYQNVVADSYKYVTTDFTADPSTFGAVPHNIKRNVVSEVKKLLESKDINGSEKEFATCMLESMKCDGEGECQNCGCCKALKENKQYIKEGVWALPNTVAKAKKLAKLMKEPLSSAAAQENLHSILGDDGLWDKLKYHKAGELAIGDDFRPKIKKRIKQYLADYEKDPKDFKGRKLNDEAKEILKGIVEKKTMLDLINDKLIQVGKMVEYKDQTWEVTKIEEGIVGIVSDGKHVSIDGAFAITVEVDGRISIQPMPEATPLVPDEVPEQAPEELSPCPDEGEPELANEVPEAKGIDATASPHIQDGYWYDGEGNPVKVHDSSSDMLVIKHKPGKTEKISLKDFQAKYTRHVAEKVMEVGATIKIEEGEHKDKEGKVTKIEEGAIEVQLEDGTIVAIENPTSVSILMVPLVTDEPAPEEEVTEPESPPEEEIEDMEAAGPLPIEKDVPESKIVENEKRVIEQGEKISIDKVAVLSVLYGDDNKRTEILTEPSLAAKGFRHVVDVLGEKGVEWIGFSRIRAEAARGYETKVGTQAVGVYKNETGVIFETSVGAQGGFLVWIGSIDQLYDDLTHTTSTAGSSARALRWFIKKLGLTEAKIVEGVDDKLAAGNLLQDKEGKDWIVKEAGDGGLTVTQPAEPGTEKVIAWKDVDSYRFTKVSEAQVEEMAVEGVAYTNKDTGESTKVSHIGLNDQTGEASINIGKDIGLTGKEFLAKYELLGDTTDESKVIEATSVQKNGEWFVESPSGAILGGPYGSKIEADKRKKDVEFYAASKESKIAEDSESFESWLDQNSRALRQDYSRYVDQSRDDNTFAKRFEEWARDEFESGETDESKVDEGFDVGDAVQIKDKEGNTTVVPEVTVAQKREVQDGVMSVEVTGSEDEDKQEWYAENEYQIIPLSRKKWESKVNEDHLTNTIANVLRDRDYKVNYEELEAYIKDLNTDDYNALKQAAEVGDEDEIANILRDVEFIESKVEEGFKTDLNNKDKAAIKAKISDITDKLLAGDVLSASDRSYWKDYGTAVGGKKSTKESISTTAKEIKNLKVEEASTRAERDKAIELLEEITDEKTQLQEKVKKEKAFEAKILVNKIGKTIEAKELEVNALRAKLEEKAKLAADLTGQVKDQKESATKVKEQMNETAIRTSKYSNSLKDDARVAEDKHQKDLSEAEKKYQKKLSEADKLSEKKVKEAKEETKERVKEEVTKEFVKCFIEFKLSETGLKIDDNSRALLENCKSLDAVDDTLDEIMDASRRGALHSESISSIHVVKREIVDPEVAVAEHRVNECFEGMGFVKKG